MVLGVDVGGTFTDAVLATPDGLVTAKAPTTPDDQSEGVLDAVRAALDRAAAHAGDVERFVHGMTVGTNALLEGKVARTALLATEGFTDIEELGRQARAELYRLCAGHPPPLVPHELRVAVPERCGPDGVLRPLEADKLRTRIDGAGQFDAAAVCLLWGFRHPEHEIACGNSLGDNVHVSLSHEAAGVFREYERCATTVVDAALSPLLRRYLERLAERATEAGLPVPEIMLSGGGVAPAAVAAKHGSWTVLSGPAGGAVGAAAAARETGAQEAVCLDMGGTSSDVSVVSQGRARESGGREVAGRALALPMVDVHTVGAGGGSIGWRDAGGALRVGPRSAGAVPGPACYGRGGTVPTVTDANLLLGHLDPDVPLAGDVRLDRDAAEHAVAKLGEQLGLDPRETAAGILRVANAEMAGAVRVMTVERGIDPRELALLAFGGAGPMHGAAVAEDLGMERVIVPAASGVLSALGMVVSERRVDVVDSVLLSGDELTQEAVEAAVRRLVDRARGELDTDAGEVRPSFDLRYAGQAFELAVGTDGSPKQLRQAFDRAHDDRYGYSDPEAEIELVTVRVTVALPGADVRLAAGGEEEEALTGPATVPLDEATLVVPDGWSARRDANGAWVLERGGVMDPVTLQVMLGALRSTCDEMGAVLVRSAHSANIKERRDSSTALFDRAGRMVMQAEHIPVHLGAMPSAVAAVLGEEQRPGDTWILNDPYRGGTHLPDITLISPVFDGTELLGFAANRAHHADVGGRTPGSMPADSRTLDEEGVVIPPSRLDAGLLDELAARMRNPAQRRADLRAQLAANRTGAVRLTALAEMHGAELVREAMDATLDYAERRTRARIAELPDGELSAEDVLEARDGDLALRLRATVAGDELELDFTGSAAQHDGNLNCPLAVTLSACYFAVRVLADPDVPPSAGAWRPVTVSAPEGTLLNARPPAAVAAGNVETSSRVADLVLAAFGHALGQGTMNNLTLGSNAFTYYETIGGGQGACPDGDGPSAVHVAMSNTLNTPIEALELEFPLRAVEYAVRRGSGGGGRWRGGDGVVRELEALEPMDYSLITERRRHPPPGAAGGDAALPGRNLLNGDELPPKAAGSLRAGDRLRIETPGGGGHGKT